MIFTPDFVAELEVLARYDLSTLGEGIKVHKTAEPSVIAATKRLFDKGLISLSDGGYLTSLGLSVAEHLQALVTIMKKD